MTRKFLVQIGGVAALLGFAVCLPAAPLQIVSLEGFLHYGGSAIPQATFNSGSPQFTSFLDANNLGSFQFAWTNTTGVVLNNLTFTSFIDLDILRDDNTFFNEFGEFVSSSLPILAPIGAIGFTDWEIDEPEYTTGNIYTNSNNGMPDNTNGVPTSGPANDVSQAFLFRLPQLMPGQTFIATGTISSTDAAGLAQIDPDGGTYYINGYATSAGGGTPPVVPEPSSYALLAGAVGAMAWRRLRCR